MAGNDSTKLGLGLWNHFGVSVALEFVVLGGGSRLYVALRSRRHPVRPVRLAVVLGLLIATYLAAIFGPPPPSVTAVGAGDIVFLLLMVVLGAWADRSATPAELAAAGQGRRG